MTFEPCLARPIVVLLAAALPAAIACAAVPSQPAEPVEKSQASAEAKPDPAPESTPESALEKRLAEHRAYMVNTTIRARGVKDPAVIDAMLSVKRHLFVPKEIRHRAYDDRPLPIGHMQTISQPYIVALMTELLEPEKDDRILEIGTGSGYQAAVLAEIVDHVYSIEIVKPLGVRAKRDLDAAGYGNVTTMIGDGYRGWPEHAPFDGVIVTAAPDHVPEPLKQQLKVGGRLVIPVGERRQELIVITRTEEGFEERRVTGVRFVPMTGEARSGQEP